MAKVTKFLRLYDLSKGSKIHGMELRPQGKGVIRDAIVVFDHIDGMFSYNTVELEDGTKLKDDDGHNVIVHLANTLLLKKVGSYYVVASEKEENNFKD